MVGYIIQWINKRNPHHPEHILRPVFDAEGTLDTAEWNTAPTVGCGPFVFEEWQSGSFARFVANDNFWLGRPKLDELFFQFVPDDASMIAALVAGDGDIGTFFAYSDVPQLKEAGITILNSFSGYNEGIYINMHEEKGNPALKDVKGYARQSPMRSTVKNWFRICFSVSLVSLLPIGM